MSVYPQINISETENKYFATFDATENTVLIPMLYVRKFMDPSGTEYTESNIASTLYTSAKDLAADMTTGGGDDGKGARYCIVDGSIDRSYVMAYNLLLEGMNVVIKPIEFENIGYWNAGSLQTLIGEATYLQILTEKISAGALVEFEDKNVYNIKFITSGAYSNRGSDFEDPEGKTVASGLYSTLINVAAARGDAVALVEMKQTFADKKEFIDTVKEMSAPSNGEFAAGFFPWCEVNCVVGNSEVKYMMPASFCYLMAYARSTASNANWFAASGVTRGEVPGFVSASYEVGEDMMKYLQGSGTFEGKATTLNIRINPIMNAGIYQHRIWGNKVYVNSSSTSQKELFKNFLNVRILLCDIRKQIYHAAMRTTFEPNDDVTWLNFKSLANSLLDEMKSGRGLTWYKWTRVQSEDRGTIKAKLTIRPIEAVEKFDIEIVLTDSEENAATVIEV